jgi:histidyl-tRNA synthetase
MADRAGATFAVIVGDRERDAGTVTLKRMHDGAEVRDVTPDGALAWIRDETERVVHESRGDADGG